MAEPTMGGLQESELKEVLKPELEDFRAELLQSVQGFWSSAHEELRTCLASFEKHMTQVAADLKMQNLQLPQQPSTAPVVVPAPVVVQSNLTLSNEAERRGMAPGSLHGVELAGAASPAGEKDAILPGMNCEDVEPSSELHEGTKARGGEGGEGVLANSRGFTGHLGHGHLVPQGVVCTDDGLADDVSVQAKVGPSRSAFRATQRTADKIKARATRKDNYIASALDRAQALVRSEDPNSGTLPKVCDMSVDNPYFNYMMGFILFLNAFFLALQVEFEATGVASGALFDVAGALFIILYGIELLLRCRKYGRTFFLVEDRLWNLFDLMMLLLMIMDEMLKHVTASSGTMVDVFKLLRMGRALRLIRMVRLVPALRNMVYLIIASMSSFVWAALLMLLMMFCFALYFTDQGFEYIQNEQGTESEVEVVRSNWGTIGSSIISLFMAMTGGDDWRNLIHVLSEASIMNGMVFYLYITFSTLVMLNLVTGVFVDGAQRIIKEDADSEIISVAAKCFYDIDVDLSGGISLEELTSSWDSDATILFCDVLEVNPEQVKDIFHILDEDRSGELSVTEFVLGCLRFRAPARAVDMATSVLEMRRLAENCDQEFKSIHNTLQAFCAGQQDHSQGDDRVS